MLRLWLMFCILTACTICVVALAFDAITSSSNSSSSDGTTSSRSSSSSDVDIPSPTPALVDKEDESFFAFTVAPKIKLNFPIDGSVPPNWVGPSIGDYFDTACYRKTYKQNSQGACPLGYDASRRMCWTQCPIAYPVKCFAECIPQNDDCILEIMAKVTNPGYVVLNIATAGVFNAISRSLKTVKKEVMCAFNIFNIAEGISRFIRFQQVVPPNGTKEELLAVVYQTDLFLVDLPVAITACMGYPVPRYAYFADAVVTAAETIVKQLMINHNLIMSSVDAFMAFFRNTTTGKSLDAESVANLTSMIKSGSSCGFNLKHLTDRVITKIADMRDYNPFTTNEDLRIELSKSSIVLQDVPAITNNCMAELLKTKKPYIAYQTRDTLRKTFGVIIDQLIEMSTTDMGEAMAREDYMVLTANMGFLGLSAIDPTGIAYMAFNYVQSICGPTEFIGEIDDGNLADALGLTTVDEAFHGSEGTWTKKGDGVVEIIFVSSDTEKVNVIIRSGGEKVATVDVESKETVTWTTTVKALQDKTLYLTRKRPGFLNIPRFSGGSLLLWLPRSSEGGHLKLIAKINVS
ncbi:unnamed protein product [Peronospora destructor]|uniref:Uncharacterized protein n=1 Tax=Peronospora destructor TaxID=86335 RepID=A0AAV0UD18_9STRA|nr:unnamed protein product [Peronospora destructor]